MHTKYAQRASSPGSLLYCCFTDALLLIYFYAHKECKTRFLAWTLLLLYCCFTDSTSAYMHTKNAKRAFSPGSLLYCCFTAALLLIYYYAHKECKTRFLAWTLLLLYCCFTDSTSVYMHTRNAKRASSPGSLLYCCFTADLLLIYC
jgi:hypothetical protein